MPDIPRGHDRYDEICMNCGRRFGEHATGSSSGRIRPNQCPPPPELGSNWENSPDTNFVGSGTYNQAVGIVHPIVIAQAAPSSIPIPDGRSTPSVPNGSLLVDGLDGWLVLAIGRDSIDYLSKNGVCAAPVYVTVPIAFTGVAFPASERDKVVTILTKGTRKLRNYCWPTDMPDTYLVEWEGGVDLVTVPVAMPESEAASAPETPVAPEVEEEVAENNKYWVAIESQDYDIIVNGEAILNFLLQYARKLKRSISIVNLHSNSDSRWNITVPPTHIRIVVWPRDQYGYDPARYRQVFGYKMREGQYDGIDERALKNLDARICDERGFVAGVRGRTIYIPFDLTHCNNYVCEVLGRILDEYAKLIAGTAEVSDQNTRETVIVDRVNSAISTMYEVIAGSVKAKIDELNSSIKQKSLALQADTAEQFKLKVCLSGMSSAEKVVEIANKAAKELICMEKVRYVDFSFSGSTLTIGTHLLNFKYKDKMFLGHWYKISLNPVAGLIKITSDDDLPTVEGRFIHPHISGGGVPCLGNIGLGVASMLTSMEIPTVVGMLIDYLQMTNDGDWYVSPLKFMDAGSEAAKKLIEERTERMNAEDAERYSWQCSYDKIYEPVIRESEGENESEEENEQGNGDDWQCDSCGNWFDEGAWRCDDCGRCENCCHGHDDDERYDDPPY